jgi:hypothetical protein
MPRLHLICLISIGLVACGSTAAQKPEAKQPDHVHSGGIEFRFATADQARQTLARRDRFVDQMSRFDRQARMQTDRDPGVDAYLKFVASEVRDWPTASRDAVRRAVELLDQPLRDLHLPDIGPITLAHTTGREESGAAYTRQSTIVLPAGHTGSIERPNQKLIAHELFHVLSRSKPELRNELYRSIGFRYVGQIGLPEQLSRRTITNPDAPSIEHVIDLKLADGSSATTVPFLFSESAFEVSKGRRLFDYMKFRLMEVHADEQGKWAAKLVADAPILHEPTIADFHRQIGGNTGYIIHPEEILADNFASLVTGSAVKDQWLIDAMRKTLLSHGEAVDSR